MNPSIHWPTVVGPALLAALVAIFASHAIERWGGRRGGIIASLPSTIVPASLGLYVSLPPPAFVHAMSMVPAGMLVNAVFLWSWRVLPPRLHGLPPLRALGLQVVISLTLWCAAAAALVQSTRALIHHGVEPLWLGSGALLINVIVGVAACLGAPASPAGTREISALLLASRGLLAGVAVGAAIVIAHAGGDLAAGMASVFPSIFLTTMVSLWSAQGAAVQVGAVGPLMLGAGSVGIYALLAALLMPAMGAAAGATVAWVGASVGFSLPAALWLRRT